LLAGQQLAPQFPLYAAVALLGAAVAIVFTQRFSDRAIRLVQGGIVSIAGVRLPVEVNGANGTAVTFSRWR